MPLSGDKRRDGGETMYKEIKPDFFPKINF